MPLMTIPYLQDLQKWQVDLFNILVSCVVGETFVSAALEEILRYNKARTASIIFQHINVNHAILSSSWNVIRFFYFVSRAEWVKSRQGKTKNRRKITLSVR